MESSILATISYGIYIVCSKNKDGEHSGLLANTVFQVSSKPSKIAISVYNGTKSHSVISESKIFSVSVLSKSTPMSFMDTFGAPSGTINDKFKHAKHTFGKTGAPIVTENAIGYFECNVTTSVDLGQHTLFFGELINEKVLNADAPMTYQDYKDLKQKVTPKEK